MAQRVDVDQHRRDVAELLAGLAARPAERVALADAAGRVLAGDVRAPGPLPRFRNSQMDGYAVRAADVAGASPDAPVVLPVAGEVAAAPGDPAPLAPGTAVRIMTGAAIPEGADAVVPVEDTGTGTFNPDPSMRPADRSATHVTVLRPRGTGEFVREAGSDVAAGAVVLRSGTLLAPHHVAAAAACGLGELPVRARIRVAVVSTGSELVAPGEPAGPGQVWDANTAALAAAVRVAGGVVVLTDRTDDDPAGAAAVLGRAARSADLVLTSGGVSQGAYEVVKDALPDVVFRSVAMQPGGPQGLGRLDGTPVLTFPGNPVSAQVSFVVLARDALRELGGLPPVRRRTARLAAGLTSPAGRRQLLRGRLLPDGGASPRASAAPATTPTRAAGEHAAGVGPSAGVEIVGGPGSHLVASMAAADVLVDVPADVTDLAAGAEVTVWPL
ncbi:molybdopterin molybdotransferase MoeA [Antribacter sp. KLBMP9083]|uniref:Molybdopterin molybdenumtransferase n=1 Tax=Antribacter soli TaxID=2910976 RepID=A0AA41QFZ3_9MICO|nr:gephyrin-like molybdotransferase Glp [Antribacter soli]MCF4122437.1 molybdopterin molybdotransferase MoeA [Antribacter soli]